jgi:hypothetical protein
MKKNKNIFLSIISIVILSTLSGLNSSYVFAQTNNINNGLDNTLDPNSNNRMSINPTTPENPNVDPLNPSFDPPTDPGGPTDPPDDVPIDGGISVLLAIGIASGVRKNRNKGKE